MVGPNGSGKSNISDAMRWVLGEISSKNIRGDKMEDVVFAGSQKRSPMGYAEVSVTFDNTEEQGKILSMADYDEITVTRRYYRVGDSEYFINRNGASPSRIFTSCFSIPALEGTAIPSSGRARSPKSFPRKTMSAARYSRRRPELPNTAIKKRKPQKNWRRQMQTLSASRISPACWERGSASCARGGKGETVFGDPRRKNGGGYCAFAF